ncbi:hypothetical protein PSENEW3n2_00003918 [Picochlorum sp. SENEW3]|nr:hypothetical protein M9435_002449 [Picochlorum sp. BPE23]KAI8110778.1 hypothetical protein M9434_004352 [Picochlorum sp. BPE23]WPT12260.1 hypothetical protein PSENEW3n2_00003918 [Picochlorum sp. SENEW3]WPT18618.1 hypothetical protein PSENEW3_00003918 [Picochlorum sp. SENEW3]|mmetsp:Transcript_12609/g.25313  ORF Transcript_12609/g.25313 Transcript_12609/m.25313 type:complete len:95 (+) Transcript_12609:151-435(+)
MDIESLEKRNDASIAALGEKTALLKNITSGIHGEVKQHHSVLDAMSKNVGGVHLGLDGAVKKMTRVMESPQGRQYLYAVVGISLALFLLYRYFT